MWDNGQLWQGLEAGELLLSRCRQCSEVCHPPLPMCPCCQSTEWQPVAASGQAQLQSWFISTDPSQSADDKPAERIVAVVALEEGVNLVSNLLEVNLEDVYEGMPLQLRIAELDGELLPLFVPLASSSSALHSPASEEI